MGTDTTGKEPPPDKDGQQARPSTQTEGSKQAAAGAAGLRSEPPTYSCGPHEGQPGDVTTPSDANHESARPIGPHDGQVAGTPVMAPSAATPGRPEPQPAGAGQAAGRSTHTAGGPSMDRRAETWGDRVRANRPAQRPPPTAAQIRGARMLQGVWNPLHVKQLTATLTTDWTHEGEPSWSEETRALRALALAPANANRDDCIRHWTEKENQTLVAYMAGGLDLPHPPNFLKEILVAEHRAMIEDFHERYLNVTLTANLPPTVRLPPHVPHAELFKELFQANTDGRFGADMMRVLQGDVKRLDYDGLHTLHVVFYSRHAANRWDRKTLRFQRAVVTLQDTGRLPGEADAGTYSSAQLDLQYAIRIYGAGGLSLLTLTRAFQRLAGAKVLDVEYARECKMDIYDNRYHTVRFAQTGCPDDLKEVTRVMLDGKHLTIHHFQTQLRHPCYRCCSPRHGTKKCTVAMNHLEDVRSRYSRVFSADVENVQPTGRSEYSISSATQLVELLTSLQADAEMQGEAMLLRRDSPAHRVQQESVEESSPTEPPMQAVVSSAPRGDSGVEGGALRATDGAGFMLHRSKKEKRALKREQVVPKHTGQQPASNATNPKGGSAKQAQMPKAASTQTALRNQPSPSATQGEDQKKEAANSGPAGAAGKRKAKPGKSRFADFQRQEAKGYYGAFVEDDDSADDDEADDAAINMQVDCADSQPAYDLHVASNPLTGSAAASSTLGSSGEPHREEAPQRLVSGPRRALEAKRAGPPAATLNIKQQSMGAMVDKADKLSISANAIKATRRQQIDANRTGLGAPRIKTEEKGGLVQTSMASYMDTPESQQGEGRSDASHCGLQHSNVGSKHSAQNDMVPATPDSQDDFTMGATRVGTAEGDDDCPVQIGQWLQSFNGHEVNVEANGHCAFLALFASTKNHPHAKMANSPATVKQATKMKSTIYASMMANLRHDVALGLVDPILECQRLYPNQSPHSSVEAATAALFAHYAEARDWAVDTWLPAEHWAGTHELRAMAQFLREPLLVLDAKASTDARIQRYLYKDYRLADGTDHESGFVEALNDREAAEYFRSCFALHVMPTFMVLRRHERHFHGVGHGDTWVKWQAEGDPTYAASLPDFYDWKEGINHLTPAEATADMNRINFLEDSPAVNSLIVKRVSPRDRLDVVHARRGLPTLDNKPLVEELDALLRTEESLIHEAYGADGYAADMTQLDEEEDPTSLPPTRYSGSATGPAVAATYRRILATPDSANVEAADLPLLELMQAENREAFVMWCKLYRDHLGIPPTRKRRAQIDEVQGWLLNQHVVMRHLFAYLPYPELEAKRWPLQQLTEWGAAEVFCEQIRAFLRIGNDTTQTAAVRNYCLEWQEACMVSDLPTDTAHSLAASADRWGRLRRWLPAAFGRSCPTDVSDVEWRLLHVLPYVVADWTRTPMGRAPHEARDLWVKQFANVRHLCAGIAAIADWSGSAALVTSRSSGPAAGASDDIASEASSHH